MTVKVTLTLNLGLRIATGNKTAPAATDVPKGVAKPGITASVSVAATPLDQGKMKVAIEYYQEGTGRLRTINCEGSPAVIDGEVRKLPDRERALVQTALHASATSPCKRTTSPGESQGTPKPIPIYRFALDQPAQCRQIDRVHVHLVTFFLRGFQDHRMPPKARIVDQQPKRLQSHLTPADMGMPIDLAAKRTQAVVHVKRLEPAKPNGAGKRFHGLFIFRHRRQGVAGREDVAGIQTYAQPFRVSHQRQNPGQVLETMPQRAALPGRCLKQCPHPQSRAALVDLVQPLAMRCNPASSPPSRLAPG